MQAAQRSMVEVVKTVVEVVSGSLPSDKRQVLRTLLEEAREDGAGELFVESVRAVGRNADTSEALYRHACANGVRTIPADMQDLCVENPNSVQKSVRRLMFKREELDKDLVATRLADGRTRKQATVAKAAATAKRQHKNLSRGVLTQAAKPKVVGAKSILERAGNLTTNQRQKVSGAIKASAQGQFGWRVCQKKVSTILRVEVKSHEWAKRFAEEFSKVG